MSAHPPEGAPSAEPGEEELRAAYEEQLARVSSAEMALQAAVSLLAVGGRRLGLVPGSESQRDLEQVRDAIDGVRALLPILERRLPKDLGPLREALSQLQMTYAQEVAGAAGEGTESPPEAPREADAPPAAGAPAGAPVSEPAPAGEPAPEPGPGPAESSGRLWVPGR